MQKMFPSEEVLTTENFDVHQDWEVPIVGFFIIAAQDRRKRSFLDFSPAELSELITLLSRVRGAMDIVLGIKDVYVFQNEDTSHGFHVWLFPRHDWMEQIGRKIESVRPIMQFAVEKRCAEADLIEVRAAAKLVHDFLSK